MKQTIIIIDVGGYDKRREQLEKTGYEIIGITPSDIASPGFLPVTVPAEWLPVADPYPGRANKWTLQQKLSWHKSNIHAIAAIEQMGIDADAYWIIESDCAATVERWQALFNDHADNAEDICTTCVVTRFDSPGRERWKVTPDWANYANLGAMYRMSRAAVETIIETAEEMREVPSEHTFVNVVHRAGGVIGRLNRTATHMNNQTMKADPRRVILNPLLVNHPVKSNTLAF